MFTEFGARLLKILGGVFQIPEHVLFKQPWIADFLLGVMQCKSCSAQWDLYVYWVSYEYVQVCVSYSSSFQKKKKNPYEINRVLRHSGLGPNKHHWLYLHFKHSFFEKLFKLL